MKIVRLSASDRSLLKRLRAELAPRGTGWGKPTQRGAKARLARLCAIPSRKWVEAGETK